MPSLFDPITIRDLEIRNRVWIAPMCMYSSWQLDGMPGAWHRAHYASFAIGRAGLITTEAAAITPDGRISPRDVGIWNDEQADAWREIVDFAHEQGSKVGIQLAHAGAKASTYAPFDAEGRGSVPIEAGGWQTVGPGAISVQGLAESRALEADELQGVVDAFVAAAVRSQGAGFDLVEVHAAHGYLLHQFLSPLSNERTDAYGGDLAGRARLLLEVVRGVHAAVTIPIVVRFSASDWTDGGWDVEQTATVAQWAIDAGADMVDASSGGLVRAEIPTGPGYQVHFAERLAQAGIPVSAVGIIETPEQADEIVRSGKADAVRLARAALRDPHFALNAAKALGVDVDAPGQYERAYL